MNKNDFASEEWLLKREKILKRDNFTCQICGTFNPSLGTVETCRYGDGTVELHEYESSPGHSLYRLSSQRTGITIEMEFGLDWLVLPVMQIHHKRYIDNRKVWEYCDNDLITLCKKCHTSLHEKIEIPVYDLNEYLVERKKFAPEDYGSGHNHDHEPWIFIHMEPSSREYKVSKVKPRVTYVLFKEEEDRAEEIQRNAEFMVRDFFKRFLPDYGRLD